MPNKEIFQRQREQNDTMMKQNESDIQNLIALLVKKIC